MMLWLRSTALFLLASTAFAAEDKLSTELMTAFHKWSDFHQKKYESHDEKMIRLQIWAENDGE